MTKARIGIIGAGWWAAVNHLPVLKANPDCEVVAVNRLGQAELRQLQDEFDVPRGFEDYREMLHKVQLDGVIVSSPHVLHHQHALAVIRRGWHVMVEKPLATTADDARDIVEAARGAGREVVVPYGWNFRALHRAGAGAGDRRRADRACGAADGLGARRPDGRASRCSRPRARCSVRRPRPGRTRSGPAARLGPAGARARPVVPGNGPGAGGGVRRTGQSPAGVDYYDAAVVRFAGGATGSLSGSSTVPKHRGFQIDLRIFGTEGMLLLDIERERLELRRRDGNDRVVPLGPGDGAYECAEPLRVFVDICRGLKPQNPAPGEVGLKAVQVLDAMYRSAASGRMEAA